MLTLLVGAIAPGTATAQGQFIRNEGGTPRIDFDDPATGERLDQNNDLPEFFNAAHCECGKQLQITFRINQLTDDTRYIVVSGEGQCLDDQNDLLEKCDVLIQGEVQDERTDIELTTTAFTFLGQDCSSRKTTRSLYVFLGSTGNWTEDAKLDITVDTQPPPSPLVSDTQVEGGESIVKVHFDAPDNTSDVQFYQVLCERADGSPALSSPPNPIYQIASEACASDLTQATDAGATDGFADAPGLDAGISSTTDSGIDGGLPDTMAADVALDGVHLDLQNDSLAADADQGAPSSGASSLAAAFVCAQEVQFADTVTIDSLAPGNAYRFYVVSVDRSRNPSTPLFLGEATTSLEEDLWERYERSGGSAEPGFCGLSETPIGVIPACLSFILFLGWRRTVRRRNSR